MSSENWSLTKEQRDQVVDQTGANLFSLAFSAEKELDQRTAAESAQRLEMEAYASAQAQSTTTTGLRPLTETLLAYVRKLAELVVEFVKSFSPLTRNGVVQSEGVGVFDLRGVRQFLSKDSAQKLFTPLFKQDQNIHTVVLSTKSFGIEAAKVAAEGLSRIAGTLSRADLSDVISGRAENEALEVLSILSSSLGPSNLTELDLSNNALGEKGLRACEDLFKTQKGLKKLTLHNIGCSPDACLALEELTRDMDLQGLFLYNNMSGDEGGKAIGRILEKMPSIKCFQMASSRVQKDGVLNLLNGLYGARELVELDLNDNPATKESVPGFLKLLETQTRLKRLNLSDTGLENEGIIKLTTKLMKSINLEALELALNEVSFEGICALAKILPNFQQLRKLDLHENELEDRGAILITKSLEHLKFFEELNLSGNQIHEIGAIAVGNSVKKIKTLKKLELDENLISEVGISTLKNLLQEAFEDKEILGSLEANEEKEDELEGLKDLDLESSTLDQLIESIKGLSIDE